METYDLKLIKKYNGGTDCLHFYGYPYKKHIRITTYMDDISIEHKYEKELFIMGISYTNPNNSFSFYCKRYEDIVKIIIFLKRLIKIEEKLDKCKINFQYNLDMYKKYFNKKK